MMRRMMRRRIQITMALGLAVTSVASTITLPGGIAQAGLPLAALSTVAVPEPAHLSDFVQDKGAAIALGKALFWDTQVGSDGIQSCATCHFHAGADSRTTNQLSPGLNQHTPELTAPDPDTSFQIGGPNYTLQATDFPLHKLTDPQDRTSTVLADTNDVVSSQGVFMRTFDDVTPGQDIDMCHPLTDATGFTIGGLNTRRVEPRNAPTVINAVFNDRNFWDGRAQNDFNGVSPFGSRDQGAQIWKLVNGQPQQVTVAITNSSLASQAVGPPGSGFEMSCAGRPFAQIGHKLLSPGVVPLGTQVVAPDDSVLGPLAASRTSPGAYGLTTSYAALVQQAFKPEYTSTLPVGDGQFTQMEANFSLFFGLAVQLYEARLVSDETPVDAYLAGNTAALTPQQQQGLAIFEGQGRCAQCHSGPELTSASVQNVAQERLERMRMGNGSIAVYDDGFYNTGVRPTFEDVGVGGLDPFGNPLSETRFDQQLGLAAPVVSAPDENIPPGPLQATEPTAVDGSFKTPGLRNVELTGPYMHNGGMATLRQVVDFYNRGGDFAAQNQANLDPDIVPLGLTTDQENALVAFLLGLTDPRVKWEKAPFDHPSLCVPNGEVGNQTVVIEDSANPGQAQDGPMLCLPAVGAHGAKTPLQPFLGLNPFAAVATTPIALPATATPTALPATATPTALPATATPTALPATPTDTATPVPSSTPMAAPSATPVPPTTTAIAVLRTVTNTPMPPTSTPTTAPATPTDTATPVPSSTPMAAPTTSHSTPAVASTRTAVPTATTTAQPIIADPTIPPTLPHLPNTGYGASATGADTRGNGALLSGALLGLLALAGGGVGALRRRSGPR